MYGFNAIQIVLLYSFLPWLMNWCDGRDDSYGWYMFSGIWVIGTIFLIIAATKQLYAVDKFYREML